MSSAQTMKIYSIISRIEQELEESPRTKFAGATNKRIVEIDRLFDLLSDLKVTIPEDIRRATGILAEANSRAAAITLMASSTSTKELYAKLYAIGLKPRSLPHTPNTK